MNRGLANRLLAVAVAGMVALWGLFWWYSGLRTIPSGVRLGDWNIGGLTESELRLEWQARLARLYGSAIRLELPGEPPAEKPLSWSALGLTADEERLSELLGYWFDGSRLSKAKRRLHMRGAVIPLELRLSEEALGKTLAAEWPDRLNPPTRNAERVVTKDDRVEYRPEQRAMAIDAKALAERVVAAGHAQLQAVFRQNADTAPDAPLQPPAVQVPLRELVPEVTAERLKAQGVERKIAEFSTAFPGSSPGRIHNIQATAGMIHDMLLAPGQRFDYAAVIRETERRFGFREAPVIYNGKLVQGIGGGICQVSTTLYNAVLRAGLQVDERRNHSLPVSYVPLGQDATFASGYINFAFTNNTGHYLLIRTESDGARVAVKLFGTMPESVTYEIESIVLQTIEPPVKYVRNPALAAGEQAVVQQGKPGYVVETYRIRKENGVVAGKERVSKDTYRAQPSLIAVRGGEGAPDSGDVPPGGVRSIIEDGVSGPVLPKGR
ncbi:VanW family protein [Paenibacillus sp. GYB003]|uniref:VanW family protein n=1 Tax=Paenibacillus sp. GYB003 TaxID=2994392 RepID=UPI002F960B35